MNCHSKSLYPGCCRNCPKLQGMPLPQTLPPPGLPVTRSNSLPVALQYPDIPQKVALPAIPTMAVISPPADPPPAPDAPQPIDGKTAIAPTDTKAGPSPFEQPELQTFLAENPKRGVLRVQAFRGQQVLPAPGVHVVVSRMFDGIEHVFYEGDTDQSGILDGLVLPAAPRDRSLAPGEPQPAATYDLLATHRDYQELKTTVDIYEAIKTTQMIQLRLKREG